MSRFVQLKEPDHKFLTPGDDWLSPPGTPFFHKVWTGETMGWSTGALGVQPEDVGEVTTEEAVAEKQAVEAELKEQEKGPPEGEASTEPPAETSEEDSDDEESDESDGDEDEESDDGDETEVSDSDGTDEGSSGKPESKSKQRGKRKGVFKRGKGR